MPFWEEPLKVQSDDVYDPNYASQGGDNKQNCEARLKADGLDGEFEVVLPENYQIQLDYDTPELPEQFYTALSFLSSAYHDNMTYSVTESRHGNRHVTIDLPVKIDDMTRIAWQAIFGSDWQREGRSITNILRGISNPSLLLERKEKLYLERVTYLRLERERSANVSGN